MSTVLNRSETGWRLIAQAEDALALGDMGQAAENGWDAASGAMKTIAEERGWEHAGIADLYAVADRLVAETGNRDIRLMFLVAAATIHNFGEGWLTEQTLTGNLGDSGRFCISWIIFRPRRIRGACAYMVSAINHTAESRRVLARAEDALALDDVAAASALIWDAAACAMRSIAESRGWKREDESDLVHAGFELAREVGNGDISTLVQVAHSTPWLVDEGWIGKDSVSLDIESTGKLLKILDSLDIE